MTEIIVWKNQSPNIYSLGKLITIIIIDGEWYGFDVGYCYFFRLVCMKDNWETETETENWETGPTESRIPSSIDNEDQTSQILLLKPVYE